MSIHFPSFHFTDADILRFFKYVEKLPNGCWFWTGARSRGKGNKKWYGTFWVGKKSIRAHRFSCEALKKQACPTGHHRDHTCRFSLCVNPDHIEVVTKEVNQERMVQDRRNEREERADRGQAFLRDPDTKSPVRASRRRRNKPRNMAAKMVEGRRAGVGSARPEDHHMGA